MWVLLLISVVSGHVYHQGFVSREACDSRGKFEVRWGSGEAYECKLVRVVGGPIGTEDVSKPNGGR